LDLCLRKTLAGKSHYFRNVIVFEKFRFQNFSVFEKLRFRYGQTVETKLRFQSFNGMVWTGPEKSDSEEGSLTSCRNETFSFNGRRFRVE